MNCVGCGDNDIIISSCAPLCRRCADNAYAGGELGDLEQELQLLSDFEMEVTRDGGPSPATLECIIAESEAPHPWILDEIVGYNIETV